MITNQATLCIVELEEVEDEKDSPKDKSKDKVIKKRVPSPEELVELEERKEIHRIYERERHHSLNMALRKMICALPSCGPNEPETKPYVLKKTHDYMQFLENKIADLCSEMDINHTEEAGHFSFSKPLHMLIDGSEHDIPADTPVTPDTLEKLMGTLDFNVSKSCMSQSCRSKRKSSKKTAPRNQSSQVTHSIGKSLGEDSELFCKIDKMKSSRTVADHDISSNSMMCTESLSDLDTSGVSQMDSSTSSNWGTASLDEGFSSCKTTDYNVMQDSTDSYSYWSSPDMMQGKEKSLADLINSDVGEVGKKIGPAKHTQKQRNREVLGEVKHPFKTGMVDHSFTKGISTVQHIGTIEKQSGKQLKRSNQGVDLGGLPFYVVAKGASRHVPKQNLGVASVQTLPEGLMLPSTSQSKALQQNMAEQSPSYFFRTIPSIDHSMDNHSQSTLLRGDNILHKPPTDDYNSSPTYGYISCTLSHDEMHAPSKPKHLKQVCASHHFHTYHQQKRSILQPDKQTIEIILDVGSNPALLDSYCGTQLASRRSPINAYQLFSKVNHKKFRDGCPPLKARELTRLISQAWEEIPEKYKIIYSKRASEWNRWQKVRRGKGFSSLSTSFTS